MRNFVTIFILQMLLAASLVAQQEEVQQNNQLNYLWPTDASKYLTSSFCEYRARRYHAGIDIKTWGKIGYHVFAIRPGYVWRVSVSPYGYGKALYLKLDTGEVAVFAHLSEFSEKIQELVEAEQKRLGKYRINMFLKPDVLPVAQGEIIALTGRTGIGAPHLHFEIRDSANRPINALSKGYQLPDKVNPVVRKISFSPLDGNSEVNGDFKPVIVTPHWVGPAEYVIKEPITIWGKVGVGVSAFDKSANSLNRFGVYALKLYVDDVLRFEYRYDDLSFQENPMIELDRDYRLSRRNLGRFYKLYKDKYNTRNIYKPNKTWAGVLQSASLTATPNLESKTAGAHFENTPITFGALFPGLHDLRIELSDYFGNTSTVSGKFKVGSAFDIRPIISQNDQQELVLEKVLTYDLRNLEELDAFVLNGKQWRKIEFAWIPDHKYVEEKGGEAEPDEMAEASKVTFSKRQIGSSPVIKFVGRDQFGVESHPFFYANPGLNQTVSQPDLTLNYDFYDDYLRLEMTSKNILPEIPQVMLYPFSSDSMQVTMHQKYLREYVGRIDLNRLSGTEHFLRIMTKSINGQRYSNFEILKAYAVRPNTITEVVSDDKKMAVKFGASSLYRPIYIRVEMDTANFHKDYDFVGNRYSVEPRDILMKKGARVSIRYPDSVSDPENLGVYYKSRKGKWVFIDRVHDATERTISARVLSFEDFALVRDETPPEITGLKPRRGVHLRAGALPRISVTVKDELSGIKSENEIEIRLNGEKLIAEYDPERHRIFYQFKQPLPRGEYNVVVTAVDKSGNTASKESVFWID